MVESTEMTADQVLLALRALDTMRLCLVGTEGRRVKIQLLAIPDEHVRIVGPDGKARWVFVARPLIAPEGDPLLLN